MPNPTIPNYPPQGIQAQLDLLYLYNPDTANQLVEQLEAGLTKLEQFQQEIEKALQDLQGVMRYKGSVATEEDLPTEGNVNGDVWNIQDTDENVAWDGEKWDKFGSAIDASKFITTEGGQIDGVLSIGKGGKIVTQIISNGANINIPNKAGTLALLEDMTPGVSEQWVKDNFINADASTYTLATLQDAFNFSNARLEKVFNEDKLPTKDSYTLFSLGWSYTDSENQPALFAVNQTTGKMYYYHGTYENCTAEAWQEFSFGGESGAYLPLTGGVLDGTLEVNVTGEYPTQTQYPVKLKAVSGSYNGNLALGVAARDSKIMIGSLGGVGSPTHGIYIDKYGSVTPVSSSKNGLGSKYSPWLAVFTKELNNGTSLAVPTEGTALATIEDVMAHSELPAQEGNAGKVLSTDGATPRWIDIPNTQNTPASGSYSEFGVKGDYCSTYAVIKAPNGRPRIKAGTNNIITVPAGLVLDCPLSNDPNDVSKGLITTASEENIEITETTDCYLVYVAALGEYRVCNTLCFTPVKPEDGTEPCKMWFNGHYWQFKSDDTGNVWRNTRAHPVCKCIFTDGVLTRLNYIGWYDIPEEVA